MLCAFKYGIKLATKKDLEKYASQLELNFFSVWKRFNNGLQEHSMTDARLFKKLKGARSWYFEVYWPHTENYL